MHRGLLRKFCGRLCALQFEVAYSHGRSLTLEQKYPMIGTKRSSRAGSAQHWYRFRSRHSLWDERVKEVFCVKPELCAKPITTVLLSTQRTYESGDSR